MPRGDKSKYTDKQERKADHIAEGYEKRSPSTKLNEGHGRPSIRTMVAARKKAAPAAANTQVSQRPTRAAKVAVVHELQGQPLADRSLQRRVQLPANGMPKIEFIDLGRRALRPARPSRWETSMKSQLVNKASGQRTFVLVLDPGEEAFAALTAFAVNQQIGSASLSARFRTRDRGLV